MTRRDRFRFFSAHGGGRVGHTAESALSLARAEELLETAVDLGVASVDWVDDDMPYDPGDADTPEDAARYFESGAWTGPYGCIVRVFDSVEYSGERTGDALQSLYGIVVGPRGTEDPYCRLVAAELASELEDELRQAIGDARDAAEGCQNASRATCADTTCAACAD